jgi:hypothetical protein
VGAAGTWLARPDGASADGGSDALAEEHFADLLPFTSLARAGEHDLRRQHRLMALLREAAGIDRVRPEPRPAIGAAVMLDAAIGTRSTQRISLQQQGDKLVLGTWPAELKPQAEALYRTGRAQRLVGLIVENPEAWDARPNVHLAYRNALPTQRLYMTCRHTLTEYVQRWTGDDFAQIGAHPHNDIRENLRPWLRERQYAGPEDDERLEAFLKRLGRRDAHLRPGIKSTALVAMGVRD